MSKSCYVLIVEQIGVCTQIGTHWRFFRDLVSLLTNSTREKKIELDYLHSAREYILPDDLSSLSFSAKQKMDAILQIENYASSPLYVHKELEIYLHVLMLN
jgi:hypothetical protein